MLSLDISGAFDNVSHQRLLYILRAKGCPDWLCRIVESFLSTRRTRIRFTGYESDWFQTGTGIPQGSPLSPILFLFFISELLEDHQRINGNTLAFGFIDDTNLITWGNSARENCQRLEAAHNRCIEWAERHGAVFAPEKYQLIHFTRRRTRRGVEDSDLTSTVRISEKSIRPETELRVLGVQVDSKLTWKAHVTHTAQRGIAAFDALSRITASTWGPSVRRSRLLYTAIVRPTMLHGSAVWGMRDGGTTIPETSLKPLKKIQNKCLKRIMGAYKRTPTAALNRELSVPPLRIHLQASALTHYAKSADHPVVAKTSDTIDGVWRTLQNRSGQGTRRRGRGRPSLIRTRPHSVVETGCQRAKEIIRMVRRETQQRQGDRNTPQQPIPTKSAVRKWADREWHKEWQSRAQNQMASIWKGEWGEDRLKLYDEVPKHVATALFLLRSEVIGLNAWLAGIGVPGIHPSCPCGWPTQTVRHVMIHCPKHEQVRLELFARIHTQDLLGMLSTPTSARTAARWLVARKLLPQFQFADEVEMEDLSGYAPFREMGEE